MGSSSWAPSIRWRRGRWSSSTACRRAPEPRAARHVRGASSWDRMKRTIDRAPRAKETTMKKHPWTRLVMLGLVLAALAPATGRAQAQAPERFGTVDFPNSCAPAVQEAFLRSVAMLHSFNYGPGERAFRDVLAQDPSCAIATWGIAAILMNNPLAGIGPPKEWAERAQAAIDEGRRIGAKTARERDYIEAVAAYYEDWANRPERTRQQNRAKAFEALAARYPTDDEAQIFYALYLASTQSLSDQTYKAYLTAADILEKQFVKHPDHPGVAHYLIHSYDAPPIAPKGVPAARRYASIAPAAPHALHMPSHIFTRVGGPYALAAIPARYAVERGDWVAATKLEPTPSAFPFTEALTHFALGLG